jgi:hypothetical protein
MQVALRSSRVSSVVYSDVMTTEKDKKLVIRALSDRKVECMSRLSWFMTVLLTLE